jgi:hypothetical protein
MNVHHGSSKASRLPEKNRAHTDTPTDKSIFFAATGVRVRASPSPAQLTSVPSRDDCFAVRGGGWFCSRGRPANSDRRLIASAPGHHG